MVMKDNMDLNVRLKQRLSIGFHLTNVVKIPGNYE